MSGRKGQKGGFAALSPEKRKEIAAKGGRAAHEKGKAPEWNSETAKAAGHKGGKASRGGRGKVLANAPTEGIDGN